MNSYNRRQKKNYLLRDQTFIGLDICVAIARAPNHKRGASQLQGETGFSLSYIEMVARTLKDKEIIETARGPSGGYFLTRPPEDITVAEIINATLHPEDRGGYINFINRKILNVCEHITLKQLLNK